MIADDDKAIVYLLTIRLESSGYKVFSAYDSRSMEDLLSKDKPDLILLDIKLPGTGGFALFESLRRSPETKSIPVIFITAYYESYLEKQILAKGAAGVIFKPFDAEDLLRKVRLTLSKADSRSQEEKE